MSISSIDLFVVDSKDNVATALKELSAGQVFVGGDLMEHIVLINNIPFGHKAALKPLSTGENIIKSGCVIGVATKPAAVGEWIHVHNMRSRYEQGIADAKSRLKIYDLPSYCLDDGKEEGF
jgi:altronate dehydratase